MRRTAVRGNIEAFKSYVRVSLQLHFRVFVAYPDS